MRSAEPQIRSAEISPRSAGIFVRLGKLLQRAFVAGLLPQLHQHDVDGQTMQPGRKRRLAPESGNLAEKLEERFLRQILCFGGIAHHPQTERIDPPVVQSVEAFKSRRVALLGESDGFCFRQLARFGSSRSGHATRRGASLIAMRRPVPEVVLVVLYPQRKRQLKGSAGCLRLPDLTKSFARSIRLIILAGFEGNVQRPAQSPRRLSAIGPSGKTAGTCSLDETQTHWQAASQAILPIMEGN